MEAWQKGAPVVLKMSSAAKQKYFQKFPDRLDWFQRNHPEHFGHSVTQSTVSLKKATDAKVVAQKIADMRYKKALQASSERVKEMGTRRRESGEGLGGGLESNKDIVSHVKQYGSIKAGRLGGDLYEEKQMSHAKTLAEQMIAKKAKELQEQFLQINEEEIGTLSEAKMTVGQMKMREKIVKGMKPLSDWESRYPGRGKKVMYATATKMAMKEEVEQIDETYKSAIKHIKKYDYDKAVNALNHDPETQKAVKKHLDSADRHQNKYYDVVDAMHKAGEKAGSITRLSDREYENYNDRADRHEYNRQTSHDNALDHILQVLQAPKKAKKIGKIKEEAEQVDEARLTGGNDSKEPNYTSAHDDRQAADFYKKELERLRANPKSYKSHIKYAETMLRRANKKLGIKEEVEQVDEAITFSNIKQQYNRNENENRHTENTLLLAKHFGTEEEQSLAKKHMNALNKYGYQPHYAENSELHTKLLGRAKGMKEEVEQTSKNTK